MIRGESLRKPLYPIALFGLTLFLLTAHLYRQGFKEAFDTESCKSVYMYPSYARIRSFDESHTKYASKYSLYLYREQGKDMVPSAIGEGFESLDGTPVLFIPGNAGSYRQVRSIAAECSGLYYDENINVVRNEHGLNLDFFAADFNEDFTAFHGRTLLDQAEYLNEAVRFILLLYAHTKNAPSSVMILAHSMGGIVARVMPTLPSHTPGCISTIVTLASPHSVAPLTFDGDILKIYLAADRFWHDAFCNSSSSTRYNRVLEAYSRLRDISVVSITGGITDSILPADYTTLGFLVPPSNGITAYTTGIPGVWTPMDHLAIVWCRQLRRCVLKALLEIVDFSSPQRVYPLPTQMSIFKKNFLTGFEETARKDPIMRVSDSKAKDYIKIKFDVQDAVLYSGANEIWKSSEHADATRDITLNLLPLSSDSTILILTDKAVSDEDPLTQLNLEPYSVFLCKKNGEAEQFLDITSQNTKEFMEIFCVSMSSDYNQIPKSSMDVARLEDSALDGEASPFWAVYLKNDGLRDFETFLIVHNRVKASLDEGFMVAQTSESAVSEHVIRGDMFSLITRGAEVSLLANRPLAVNFNVPAAWSSLLAYEVTLKESSGDLFEPFIRQWVEDPHETKWIIKLRGHSKFLISMHGVAPYTPFTSHKSGQGLNLQLWSDPQGGWSDENVAAIELFLSVDWIRSLRLLVMRYRLAVVSHCIAVTAFAMILQFRKYNASGLFPDYIYGLSKVCSLNIFVPVTIILWLLSPITKVRVVQYVLNMIDPVVLQDPNEINLSLAGDYKLNSFYLGLEENCLAFIGPLFFAMAIGINLIVYHLLTILGIIIAKLASVSTRLRVYLPKNYFEKTEPVTPEKSYGKKVIVSALLLILIPFHIPYQFAYVISFVIHTTTCIKILLGKPSKSCWNFNISILMMMAWVLPINIPVLIVFVHNLNVSWATPFSSHHNFLAVAPILMMVEICSYFGNSLPLGSDASEKTRDSWANKLSFATLAYLGVYSIVYGTRHTFWLHHLFNFWCCCICVMFMSLICGASEQTR